VPWMLCVQSSFDAQEVSIWASGGPKSPASTRRMHVMVLGLRPWGRMELGAPLCPKTPAPKHQQGRGVASGPRQDWAGVSKDFELSRRQPIDQL
jgi:hypothetical protein